MVPMVPWYTCTHVRTGTCTYHGTYTCTENVMSQLSDWKRAHMCTENHVYVHVYVPVCGTGTCVRTRVPRNSSP
jgi:hypothetical protein